VCLPPLPAIVPSGSPPASSTEQVVMPSFGALAEPSAPSEGPPAEVAGGEADETAASEFTFQGSPAPLPSETPVEPSPPAPAAKRTRFTTHREAAKAAPVPPTQSIEVAPAPAVDAPAMPRTPLGHPGSFGADDLDEEALRQAMQSSLTDAPPAVGDVTPPEAAAPVSTDAYMPAEPAVRTPPPGRRRVTRNTWADIDLGDDDVSAAFPTELAPAAAQPEPTPEEAPASSASEASEEIVDDEPEASPIELSPTEIQLPASISF
jgi:hypothetical protein